jgi:predicted PurR-regulated permease PerM
MTGETSSSGAERVVGPDWLRRTGMRSWYIVGVIAVLAIGIYLVARAASIVVPFLLAVILGVLFVPVVDWLERHKLPRAAGAAIVMVLILVVVVAVSWVVIQGIATQVPVIEKQLTAGFDNLNTWLATRKGSTDALQALTKQIQAQIPKLASSMTDIVVGSLSGIASMLFGAFILLYILFFTLSDSARLADWTARHLGFREDIGHAIVADSGTSIRQYFRGTGITAIITSLATGLGLWFFHVPLIGPIMVVTFVMVFIPYIGAVVSTTFAVLIALGAGGATMALETLAVCLLVLNGLQGAVAAWAIGGAMDLHPLVVILSTMLGGIFAGIIGAILGAPLTAILVRAASRLREMSAEQPAEPAPAPITEPIPG